MAATMVWKTWMRLSNFMIAGVGRPDENRAVTSKLIPGGGYELSVVDIAVVLRRGESARYLWQN